MSNNSQNIYGINNSADTYYGTLFSHLSYGMGEGNASNSPTTPNAESAAAAALAAAASGRNNWSNADGYSAVSNIMTGMRAHPSSMTSCSNSGDLSESSCGIPSSSLASPYAATLLAAVAAAAAAAYPLPQGAASTVPAPTGRQFLPNASMNNRAADFTTMYYGSSPRPSSVTTANQLGGLLGNLPSWPFTVPPAQYPNHSFIERSGGAVVPLDGWTSSNGQQLTLSPACGEADSINHFGQGPTEANVLSKDSHTYYTTSNMRDAVFAAPVSYSQQQHQINADDPGVSFIYPHLNAKPVYPFPSHVTQSHLVNGLPGGASNVLDPYVSVNQHQKIPQLVNEFNRLNVCQSIDIANRNDNGVNHSHSPFYEGSVVGNGNNVQPKNTSYTQAQWCHRKENNGINSAPSMDQSEKASRSQPSSSGYPANRLTTSSNNRSAQPPVTTSVNNSPRTKTWANIAGQPPKGSAAVLQNSVGWSTKRSQPHNLSATNRSFQTTGSYPAGRTNSLITSAPSSNGHVTHQEKANAGEKGSLRSLTESNSEMNSTQVNNDDHSTNTSTSALLSSDESAQAFQRESEALHQRLAKVINPTNFDTHIEKARFFVIKSFSEDDIHRSIKYSIWCSTELGNKKLDTAFAEANHAYPIYLFFSVNGSGHFCGMAEMVSRVDYNARASVWAQDKWQGKFSVRWIFVKDVPNTALRHIRIETNDNKPVTHSRDTTELPLERGRQVMEVLATYSHTLSIFDDFFYYDQRERQEEVNEQQYLHPLPI
ncbi:unnamed protein product [Heterobilharzia americana]|nr:unnamed protein product [Heterobilharzia americana]